MDFFSNLKTMSRDFLLFTNLNGTEVEVGSYFHSILQEQNLSVEDLKEKLKPLLPSLEKNNSIVLPLEQDNIYSSPFVVLHQESQLFILIAEDLGSSPGANSSQYKKMKALLDESSDPIFGFKEDGTYFYVNNIFGQTLGYKKEEIINKKIWDIFPQKEADKRFAVVQEVFNSGTIKTIEVQIPLPDGDKYFLTTAKPFKKKEDDSVEFVICISKDITELRNTQEQLKTLKGLIPICSNCKNIKNDEGSWQQLEEYISKNSEAQFSHGICPECVQSLYPGISLKK